MAGKKQGKLDSGLADLWRNCVLGLKFFFYGIAIVFFIIGVAALFWGGIGIGIFLMALNAFLICMFFRLDRKTNRKFDREFDEMVKKNKGE